jgi:HSP20 family molecular chaperone IbpA
MADEVKDLQVQDVEKQEIAEVDAERTRDRRAFVPRADIYETKDALVVVTDVPGVDENSVDIVLEKGVLSIDGYVKPQEVGDYCLAYAEYDVGDYQRRFTLPEGIDQDKIEATVKNGILRLVLPKADVAKTKKIAVQAA